MGAKALLHPWDDKYRLPQYLNL
ncbi:hypothetical protein A2U01_0062277 [Trifolium medium]|uniref:Uncharacterized protein n=1 Tax=Trifolium medium TaxID=97028 RepID=A0A392RY84_9FABA|nr:hypothetical protein [Trifolium medium]